MLVCLWCAWSSQIKLWDFDQAWALLCTFEGHAHYVMQTQWNPRDSGLFASCSLDRRVLIKSMVPIVDVSLAFGLICASNLSSAASGPVIFSYSGGSRMHIFSCRRIFTLWVRSIKVWGVGNILAGAKPVTASVGTSGGAVVTSAHFTLLGHERGVNAIAYSKRQVFCNHGTGLNCTATGFRSPFFSLEARLCSAASAPTWFRVQTTALCACGTTKQSSASRQAPLQAQKHRRSSR